MRRIVFLTGADNRYDEVAPAILEEPSEHEPGPPAEQEPMLDPRSMLDNLAALALVREPA